MIQNVDYVLISQTSVILWGGRVQSMSCSKDCKCSDKCCNKPFRKDKRLKVVKVRIFAPYRFCQTVRL